MVPNLLGNYFGFRSFVSLTDLAPGNDEIYEEKQETFLTVGNPQDGQVVLYKVGTALPHLRYIVRWYS